MSTEPVTLMVARRVARGRYDEFMAWLREGERLATDFPGYLGSGVLAPRPGADQFQRVFPFSDDWPVVPACSSNRRNAERAGWTAGLVAVTNARRAGSSPLPSGSLSFPFRWRSMPCSVTGSPRYRSYLAYW